MLGRQYGSVQHYYIPHLVPLDKEAEVFQKHGDAGKKHLLFKLGWGPVDNFKRAQYIDWVEKHWKHKCPAEMLEKATSTLPDRYNTIINDLVFALPHAYHTEIIYFTSIYYQERHRIRNFDTSIRDMCLDVSKSAINCAFKLLADCVYDPVNMTWFRENNEVNKFMIQNLLMYKFWRDVTGRGLVWDHAEMQKLEESAALMEREPYRETANMVKMYRRCLREIKQWEKDQERFWSFANVDGPKLSAVFNTQEVRGEVAEVAETAHTRQYVIAHSLAHLPFIDGSVVLTVYLDGAPHSIFKFDGKKHELVKSRGIVSHAASLDSGGQLVLRFSMPAFSGVVTAGVDYEYTIS